MSRWARSILLLVTLLVLQLSAASLSASAATYWISPEGQDGAAGTQAAPWKTFRRAFDVASSSHVRSGDKLVLADGLYTPSTTGVLNTDLTAECSGCPVDIPDGTPLDFTVIQAENRYGARLDSVAQGFDALWLGTNRSNVSIRYIEIDGLIFYGGVTFYNADHIYLHHFGAYSEQEGVGSIVSIGTSDHSKSNFDHFLLEDGFIWGRERKHLLNFRTDHNVFRRIVIRPNTCCGCHSSGNGRTSVSEYNSQHTVYQNVIVLDADRDGANGECEISSTDFSENSKDPVGSSPGEPTGPTGYYGCMSINSERHCYDSEKSYVSAGSPSTYSENFVCWDAAYGLNVGGGSGKTTADRHVNFTIGALTRGGGSRVYRLGGTPSGDYVTRNGFGDGWLSCGISEDADHLNLFDREGVGSPTCFDAQCLECLSSDPQNDADGSAFTNDSLKYLVRVEENSRLSGTGSADSTFSRDIGATVLKRYGRTGAAHGESGYLGLTGEDLWPWPDEDVIRAEFCDGRYALDQSSAFCSARALGDGSPATLTEYIWEYLGHQIPPEVYGPASGVCGDGVKGPGETCDGSDLGGQSCESLGFTGGSLACAEDCQSFDTSGCRVDGPPAAPQNLARTDVRP
ncbi:MAG: hypothetical protein JSV80_02515 [Acidobacteriota bacterium]|nr:MAG: hypothetical protein JSV80_02515 [Acidobacteriota bacterium]